MKVTATQLSISTLRYYGILASTIRIKCACLSAAVSYSHNFVHLMVPIALIMGLFQLNSRFQSHDSCSLAVIVDSEIETVNINPN